MTSRLRSMMVLGLLGTLLACSRKAPEPSPVAAPAPKAPLKTVEINDEPGAKLDPNDPKHGTRKLLNLDAPVYVDGVQAAVVRYGDLAIAPVEILEGGTPSFAVVDYLKSIGVSPESVKSVHFHGNNDRIGSIEGAELKKEPKRFTFTFQSAKTGAPIQRWDTEGLKNEFVVHEIRKVSIYVKKTAPAIHPQRRCHLGADGACSDAMPYAQSEPAKGTRVYVDGKMVGFVKRRQLSDSTIVGETKDGERKYSVAKLLAGFGVDVANVKAVELVAGDDVIGRSSADEWSKLSPSFFFTLPKHNHGKVRVHVPSSIQAKEESPQDRDALVSSVLVYKSATPTNRDLTAISEDTDLSVQLATATADEFGRGER